MKKSELRKLIREEIIELNERRDLEPTRNTGKDLFKCWECERGRCRHTGTQQGTRGGDCQSHWGCFLECGRYDDPNYGWGESKNND